MHNHIIGGFIEQVIILINNPSRGLDYCEDIFRSEGASQCFQNDYDATIELENACEAYVNHYAKPEWTDEDKGLHFQLRGAVENAVNKLIPLETSVAL